MALLGSAGCSNMRIWVGVPVPCRKLGAKEGETGGTLELADHLVQTNHETPGSVKDLVSKVWWTMTEEDT